MSKAETTLPKGATLKCLISPHAGYAYSGPTAAWAYKNIDPTRYDTVFVLGPSHHAYLDTCAVSGVSLFETPLGDLQADLEITAILKETKLFPQIPLKVDEAEHSLEMQYPYLRLLFGERAEKGEVRFVSIMVGDVPKAKLQEYAEILASLISKERVMVAVSSDFCHHGSNTFGYAPTAAGLKQYEVVEQLDRRGMDLIEEGNEAAFKAYLDETKNTICGQNPIRLMMEILAVMKEKMGVKCETKFVAYAQSSKAMKVTDHSVSYAASYTTV